MSGLFGTFNVAKRGMEVFQKAIDVTGHNMSNELTPGYSRQRAVIETTKPFGMPSINTAFEPGQMGTGAEVTTVQRVRDVFLDYQIRKESSTNGQFAARDKYLGQVEDILNEPSDTGISKLMGKFFATWQDLAGQAQNSNARTVVAQQSSALANELNHSYIQLKKLKEDAQTGIKDDVFEVNNMLGQLDQINQQIIGVKVAGNQPNDLMDRRDLLLDQLSVKFNIKIDKKTYEGNDISPLVSGNMTNASFVKSVEKDTVQRLSYVSSVSSEETAPGSGVYKLTVTYYKKGDMSSETNKGQFTIDNINDADPDPAKAKANAKTKAEALAKDIDECRVLWANSAGEAIDKDGNKVTTMAFSDIATKLKLFGAEYKEGRMEVSKDFDGEMKGFMSVQKDIGDYMNQLNKLAKALAFSVNALHSGQTDAGNGANPPGNPPTSDYMPFFVNGKVATYTPSSVMNNLGAVLAAETDITAENISMNKEIMSDVMKIKTRQNDDQFAYAKDNNIDGDKENSRALAIAGLKDKLIKIQDIGEGVLSRKDLFDAAKGGNSLNKVDFKSNDNGMKVESYFKNTVDTLGVQEQEAKRMVKNQGSVLGSFAERKQSVSGVSRDEEMTNLIQFQHCYQANAKLISTIDQLLDVVVNGLKR